MNQQSQKNLEKAKEAVKAMRFAVDRMTWTQAAVKAIAKGTR